MSVELFYSHIFCDVKKFKNSAESPKRTSIKIIISGIRVFYNSVVIANVKVRMRSLDISKHESFT